MIGMMVTMVTIDKREIIRWNIFTCMSDYRRSFDRQSGLLKTYNA
jgi:hypothetical protein